MNPLGIFSSFISYQIIKWLYRKTNFNGYRWRDMYYQNDNNCFPDYNLYYNLDNYDCNDENKMINLDSVDNDCEECIDEYILFKWFQIKLWLLS